MKLKEYRKAAGLTQAEAALILGIPTKTYQNYERGVREPDSDVLCTLADHYNVTLDELVGRDLPDPSGTPEYGEMLSLYLSMSDEGRAALIAAARGLAASYPR